MDDLLIKSGVLKTTATELCLCQRCPRLMAYHKKGEKNVRLVGYTGTGASYGKLFHDLAGKFYKDVAEGSLPELTEVFRGEMSEVKVRLDDLIRTRYFTPFLAEKSANLKYENLMALAKGTEFWIHCLADFLSGIPSLLAFPKKYLSAVFHQPEKILSAAYPYPDGRAALEVSGKYDCLLFNPDMNEAALFEFKGFKSTDVTVELSQTLVYAWLVSEATGIVPSIRLIYLEDDEPRFFPAADVKNMLGNLVYLFDTVRLVLEKRFPIPEASNHELCNNCRFSDRCGADWGDSISDVSEQPPAEQTGQVKATSDEARQSMSRLVEALGQLQVFVSDEGYVEGPCFIRLKIKPDSSKGITVRKIANKAEDLQVALALSSPPLIQAQSGYVSVDVPRNTRRVLTLPDMMKGAGKKPGSGAAFPLGLDIDGKVYWTDLAEPVMTSILIGGTSGSGKSVLLRSIVIGLLLNSPRGEVSFTLIDPKRVTFTDMKTLDCLEEKSILCDIDSIMEALRAAVGEMERRYVLMEKACVSDIAEYNKSATDSLKRRVLIIDEYADMIVSSQTRAELEIFVQRICQKGRAAGIHLILATQRPDANVVTGVIKANLQLRVALKVTSKSNSQIILGEGIGQAQYLLGHGDMLVGGSVALQRLQAPLASIDLLRAQVP